MSMSTGTGQRRQVKAAKSFDFFDFLYKYGTIVTILILIAVFGIMSESFLMPTNIINILRSISIVTVIAIGITISLSVGGFDLSVGSVASLANAVVISMFVWHSQNAFVGIITAIAVCLIAGLLNAFMIVKMRIQDMLMTLAMMFIIQGWRSRIREGRLYRRTWSCRTARSPRARSAPFSRKSARCRGLSSLCLSSWSSSIFS